ncbi:uncharacterized protein [Gossypium hirsutum]|uniref:Gag-pro-like protein n=1 Tax=Gossypium hirsutum TaxID=3635 RepID=A0A1U8PCD6_GOSHI|nr:uncharacterized protein LOC107957016 [Gossypium hirsutum]
MQNDMREQMLEAQRNMMAEMAQLLRATNKGKAPTAITGEEGEDHPPGFTPPHVPTQIEALSRRPSVTIRPQQGSVDTGIPMNFPTGSGFNLGDNPANLVIPDLDMAEKEDLRIEAARQLEDRCKWLEEKFKALENANGHHRVDAKDLSLVPDLPPYPKWYDANARCEYHARILGHSIENCTGFKKAVERLIKMGVVKFDNTPNIENPLPNHSDQGVNAIGETSERRVKEGVAKVRTPMKMIWEEMVKREMIISKERNEEARDYYEFHAKEGHKIQECDEFKALIQSLMDNKELGFYEAGPNKRHICTLEGAPKNQNRPRIIISLPGSNEVEIPTVPKVIIHKPVSFPYKDNKRVPWSYNCHVSMPEREDIASASKEVQGEGSHTRSEKRYDTVGIREEPVKEEEAEAPIKEPVKEEEAKEFLKFLKHSEYSMVEQLRKQPARISVLALLLSSEVHWDALMKVLNEKYVIHDISVNKLDRLVNNIIADNFIYFNDDEIPPRGRGSIKALYITTRCKGYALPGVLIDNGSALNVLPLSTLNRLPIDGSHMKICQNVVRAFDGTERKVMVRIDISLEIGPNIYEVDFLVMDIKPSYNCLLGRSWIHSAGAVPSSLHQKLKLVTNGRLVTINAEEGIIPAVTSKTPYVETNEKSIECSFRSLEFVNATFISEGSEPPVTKIVRATRMALQMIVGKGALPGRG